ncbi:hypothetical protein [Massilia oculi]|uniref:hypothetical protein n=1 Tax=Massilia oculi TaxID=945844 RepID=UPI001AAFBC00|nr:hypothetical protein [Massilia oculi]
MIAATAPRAAVGTGELSQALHEANDRDALNRFCSAHVCTPADVSEDGVHMHLPSVLQLMRSRGYQVSEPTRSPHQPKRGLVAWIVRIQIKHVRFDLAFYTPAATKAGTANKTPPSRLEHA